MRVPVVASRACLLLAGMVLVAGAATAIELPPARDSSVVQLAWRGDPRPTADAPAGVDVPQGRRPSRRSQRRSTRRRQPLDEPAIKNPPTIQLEPERSDSIPFQADVPDESIPTAFTSTDAAPSGITTHRDQPYGQERHARQRFDIHLPSGCSTGGMPLVVWIHGDSWRDGSKADCPITWLAQEGYAVASIGYRLSDTAVYPAQLDDCRAAIAEIEQNAAVWGIDPSRVAVVGSGGGGLLAALVAVSNQPSPPLDATAGSAMPLPRIAAACTLAAPTNLTTLGPEHDRTGSPASRLVGGPLPEFREAAQRASPVAHVSSDDPPLLILHGATDSSVPLQQAKDFDAALRAAAVDSTLVILPGVGRKPSIGRSTPSGLALLSFLDRVLGPGIRPEHAPLP